MHDRVRPAGGGEAAGGSTGEVLGIVTITEITRPVSQDDVGRK